LFGPRNGQANTLWATADAMVEEVQGKMYDQNESLLAAHLKGEHNINRCHGAGQNWSRLAQKLLR